MADARKCRNRLPLDINCRDHISQTNTSKLQANHDDYYFRLLCLDHLGSLDNTLDFCLGSARVAAGVAASRLLVIGPQFAKAFRDLINTVASRAGGNILLEHPESDWLLIRCRLF